MTNSTAFLAFRDLVICSAIGYSAILISSFISQPISLAALALVYLVASGITFYVAPAKRQYAASLLAGVLFISDRASRAAFGDDSQIATISFISAIIMLVVIAIMCLRPRSSSD